MKSVNYKRLPHQVLPICLALVIGACHKPANKSQKEIVQEKLVAKTWNMQTVSVDGVDKTSMFTGLTLSITPGAYNTTNGHLVWPASGTWEFTDASATAFTRDDQVVVTIDEVTATSLKLSLTWAKTTYGSGRVSSLSGKHAFSFTN